MGVFSEPELVMCGGGQAECNEKLDNAAQYNERLLMTHAEWETKIYNAYEAQLHAHQAAVAAAEAAAMNAVRGRHCEPIVQLTQHTGFSVVTQPNRPCIAVSLHADCGGPRGIPDYLGQHQGADGD